MVKEEQDRMEDTGVAKKVLLSAVGVRAEELFVERLKKMKKEGTRETGQRIEE